MKKKVFIKISLGVFSLLVIIGILSYLFFWTWHNYHLGEFTYEFIVSLLATFIGVIIGALLAIALTIGIINPLIKKREEKRLKPLRQGLLKFWDNHLTLYTTSLFNDLEFPNPIAQSVSDVSMQVTANTNSVADENKLLTLEEQLLSSNLTEEIDVLSMELHKNTLEEYKRFLLRMHDTLVALPYLFKEIPELASSVEVLVGNYLSGLEMMEYKGRTEGNATIPVLESYGANIIKFTDREAFRLV